MFSTVKLLLISAVGAVILCPLCESRLASAASAGALAVTTTQVADTATARLHISGMTCGTCPTTARVALKRVPGVFSATVTLADSLGVVRYDPSRVTAKQIARRLTELTGYGARLLSDTSKLSPPSRSG